jgi:hypothetical protein
MQKNMEIICQNIINIKNYLNMCRIHLDKYITILKQAYQCLSDICNPCNNYMVYNAARVKLCIMMKEAENTVRSSFYKDLPIFYNGTGVRSGTKSKPPTSIKFPMFVCTNDSVNKMIAKNIGGDNAYFKIELMRISLRHLKLEKYCYPPLSQGDRISMNTSPIPPCDCPVGMTPKRDMYVEPELSKCWDMNYHLKQFKNAMYRVTMAKDILCNYSKLVEIKEELCYKIKIANLKVDY